MKCYPLLAPMSDPENDASIVKMLGILSSLHIAILAVASLDLCIEKRDWLKEKESHSFDKMNGKILVASGYSGELFPYINTFCLLEWPCKSQYKPISRSFEKAFTNHLIANTYGCKTFDGALYLRFRSLPHKEQR